MIVAIWPFRAQANEMKSRFGFDKFSFAMSRPTFVGGVGQRFFCFDAFYGRDVAIESVARSIGVRTTLAERGASLVPRIDFVRKLFLLAQALRNRACF